MHGLCPAAKHPEFRDRFVIEVFDEEKARLMPYLGPFAGFVEKPMQATTTCLITHNRSKYSVDARAAGRAVLVRAYADRIVVLLDGETVADHPRSFKRDQVVYDPWHYLPVLIRKPGALRNGAPFKGLGFAGAAHRGAREAAASCRWRPPVREDPRPRPRRRHRRGGGGLHRGARGQPAATSSWRSWRDVVSRRCPRASPTPDALKLKTEPVADCARYDNLRRRRGSCLMERHQLIEAMTSLKLYGMRASFDEIAGKGLSRREEIYPLLASLVRANWPIASPARSTIASAAPNSRC